MTKHHFYIKFDGMRYQHCHCPSYLTGLPGCHVWITDDGKLKSAEVGVACNAVSVLSAMQICHMFRKGTGRIIKKKGT
jgi:hypothetical protein